MEFVYQLRGFLFVSHGITVINMLKVSCGSLQFLKKYYPS